VYVVGGYAWAPLVKCTHDGVLTIGHPGFFFLQCCPTIHCR